MSEPSDRRTTIGQVKKHFGKVPSERPVLSGRARGEAWVNVGLNGVYHVHTAFIILTFGLAVTSMVCCLSFDRQPVQTENDRQYIVDFYTPKLYDA